MVFIHDFSTRKLIHRSKGDGAISIEFTPTSSFLLAFLLFLLGGLLATTYRSESFVLVKIGLRCNGPKSH